MCPGHPGILPDFLCTICQQPCHARTGSGIYSCIQCNVQHLCLRPQDPSQPTPYLIEYNYDDPVIKQVLVVPEKNRTVVCLIAEQEYFGIDANHEGYQPDKLLELIYKLELEYRYNKAKGINPIL